MKSWIKTTCVTLGLLISTLATISGENRKPLLTLEPAAAVYATPYTLSVTGLQPEEKVTLTAVSIDARGVRWESRAAFQADTEGGIDLDRQPPLNGEYEPADPLGLLWTLRPTDTDRPLTYYGYDTGKGIRVEFILTDAGNRRFTARLVRWYEDPQRPLRRTPLDTDGLKGTLFSPSGDRKYPGVILLSGSNGGSVHWLARALAVHGFSVLDLPYFKTPGLPEELINIPLEYFQRAIHWMRQQKTVTPGKIGMIGGSRGGELALLLGSMFDEFKTIVAWVPAAHLWQGEDYEKLVPTWTWQGKALPFLGKEFTPEELQKFYTGEMTSYRGYFENVLKTLDPAQIEAAAIPVEKIRAPLLLISGEDDQTWPSTPFCRRIMDRLEKNDFPCEHRHLAAKNGGHQVFLPDFITATCRHFNGGTRKSELIHSIRFWQETVKFLHKYMD